MSFFRLCNMDNREGFRRNLGCYVAACGVFSLGLLWMRMEFLNGIHYGALHGEATYTDVVLYLMRGVKRFYPERRETYQLPIIWFICQALLLSMTGGYPYRNSCTYRQQIILRLEKKTYWWYSKCLWCVETVVSFYFLCYAIAALWCFFFHISFRASFSAEFTKLCYGTDMEKVTGRELWVLMTVLPVSISSAMSLLQLFLGLAFGSRIAFLLTMGMHAVSTVLCLPWLPGNYSMILRSTAITPDGVNTGWGLCLSAILAFLSTLLGSIWVTERDSL